MGLKIAMIEDDEDLRLGMGDTLELLGHEYKGYASAAEFFKDEENLSWHDLIITDYYLEDVNGINISLDVRARGIDTPIILLTGSRESFITNSITKIPNALLLHKPCQIEDIEAVILKFFPENN